MQMSDHDAQIVGVGQGVFRRLAEEIARMVANVLVERVVAGDHDGGDCAARRPARPICCQVEAIEPG